MENLHVQQAKNIDYRTNKQTKIDKYLDRHTDIQTDRETDM